MQTVEPVVSFSSGKRLNKKSFPIVYPKLAVRVRLPSGNAKARLPPSPQLHEAKAAVKLLATQKLGNTFAKNQTVEKCSTLPIKGAVTSIKFTQWKER